MSDIPEREESEQGPNEGEEKMRALLKHTPSFSFVVDVDGTVSFAEGEDLEAFALDPEEMEGRSFHALFESHPDFRRKIERALKGETVDVTSEVGGRIFDVWLAPYVDDQGKATACLGTLTDVTERRTAQSQLRETKNFYEQLLNHLPMELAVFDSDARFQYVSLHGVSDPDTREWVIGRTNEEYCRHHDLDLEIGRRRDKAIRRAVRSKETIRIQETIDTKSGRRHYVRIHVPVTNLEGEVTNVVGCSLDITERVRKEEAEEAQKELQQELLQASERERHRIGRDLHDGLASHMTGMATIAQSLLGQAEEDETLSVAARSLKRIVDLAQEGAKQARAMARGLNPVKLDQKGLPSALQTLAENQELRFRIACDFEQEGSLPELSEKVAINLYWIAHEAVQNAVKHGEANRVLIWLVSGDGHVTLQVEDDGIGLPASVDEIDAGMGLATMQYRADLIGASLDVQNREDGGVRVSCTLTVPSAS